MFTAAVLDSRLKRLLGRQGEICLAGERIAILMEIANDWHRRIKRRSETRLELRDGEKDSEE